MNHKDCGASKIVNKDKEFNQINEYQIHLRSFKKIQKILTKKFPNLKTEFYLMSLNKKITKVLL